MRRRRRREAEFAELLDRPEIAAELDDLARIMSNDLEDLTSEERGLRLSVDESVKRFHENAAALAKKLDRQDPEDVAELVRRETGDASLANRVAYLVWRASLIDLSDETFSELAIQTEAELSPRRVDYVDRMVALDEEMERRGLPLAPPLIDLNQAKIERKPEWSKQDARFMAASAIRWELNALVAEGYASDAEISEARRAEAELARASRLTD